MSHFYGDLTGSRGSATRCGTPSSGITAHPRGWDVGVKVYGTVDADGPEDTFEVMLTGGSSRPFGIEFARVVKHGDGWMVRLTRPDGTTEILIYS